MFSYHLIQFLTLNLTLNENKPKNVYFYKPEGNLENLEKFKKKKRVFQPWYCLKPTLFYLEVTQIRYINNLCFLLNNQNSCFIESRL